MLVINVASRASIRGWRRRRVKWLLVSKDGAASGCILFWYSLEVRLSHELLDLLGGLMLPPLGVGPPANNDDPLVKGK